MAPSGSREEILGSGDTSSRSNVYERLEDGQIRLVELLPASSEHQDAPVICRLKSVSRDHAPAYRALSYCWGHPEEHGKGEIFLEIGATSTLAENSGRVKLAVTPTLERALHRLRSYDSGTSQLIWIDALSINQEDEKEKGQQVQCMQLIYQNATEVAVWLGDEDEKSLLAWDLIEKLEKLQHDTVALRSFLNPSREPHLAALLHLFRRAYFWRIWVVQELTCAAQKAQVYCGSKTMSWSDFQNIGNIMDKVKDSLRDSIYRDKPAALFSLMSGGPRKLEVTRSQEKFTRTKAPPLLNLLMLHMSKLSTNPHDKVYGLMGISSDGPSFGPIDYERSPRATFVHVARCIISNTNKLNIICLNQNDDNIYHLPSWVTDWERRCLHPSHRVVGLHIRKPPFKAAKETFANAKFAEDGEVLTATGFIVDTITTAAQPLYIDGPESEVTSTLMAFHNWFTTFINNCGKTADLEVFARTFCGGAWSPQYSEFEKETSQRLVFFFGLIQKLLPSLLKKGNLVGHLFQDTGVPRHELEAREYAMVASAALRMHAKRFVITKTKLAGLAPRATEEGDKIVVFFGCDFPVVMRDMGSYWTLIGEVYVDGIMYGEAMNDLPLQKYEERSFSIR